MCYVCGWATSYMGCIRTISIVCFAYQKFGHFLSIVFNRECLFDLLNSKMAWADNALQGNLMAWANKLIL